MIRRTHLAFEDHYTQVPNEWVRDERLSRKARGLLVELMSHTAGWNITIQSLVDAGPEGESAIKATIRELEAAGYLRRERTRTPDGRMGHNDYIIQDPWAPPAENPPEVTDPLKKNISQKNISQKTRTTHNTADAAMSDDPLPGHHSDGHPLAGEPYTLTTARNARLIRLLGTVNEALTLDGTAPVDVATVRAHLFTCSWSEAEEWTAGLHGVAVVAQKIIDGESGYDITDLLYDRLPELVPHG